ncbi:hypothetical protein HHI36_015937 [Cryptolaemus montrouzieri]|uniref:RHD domain-containing protein n=1 Tax=Cryptolaemus montrouzieri TaxID=559131 RepID=A0ABD2N8M7_9CUCU
MYPGEIQHTTPSSQPVVIAKPYVQIVEQPAGAVRFRYECEGRSAGSMPGVSNSNDNKTFPAIKVMGYKGRAFAVVSCVTADAPYRPHPNKLVGREGCKHGVCTLQIPSDTMTIKFSNLGIQCVTRKRIGTSLRDRQSRRIDPFGTGFEYKGNINQAIVRLCFQVFLEGNTKGKFNVALDPVVSEPIIDKKKISELVINKLSHCTSYVDANGGDIILLCGKIIRNDIQIRFFEEKDGATVWEGYGQFKPSNIHKNVAISFRPPRYQDQDVQEPVKVFIQLRRPSNGELSEPLPFQFLPLPDRKRKRLKFADMPRLMNQLGPSGSNIWPQGGLVDAPQVAQPEAINFPTYCDLPSTSSAPQPTFSENWNLLCIPEKKLDRREALNVETSDPTIPKHINISSGDLGSLVAVSNNSNCQYLPPTNCDPLPPFSQNWNYPCFAGKKMVCDNSMNPERDEPVLPSSVKQININAGDSFGSLINIDNLQDHPVGSSSPPLMHYNFPYLPDKESEYIQLIDQPRTDTSPDYILRNINISTGDLDGRKEDVRQ